MVYTKDLKSFPFIAVVGSSPTSPTIKKSQRMLAFFVGVLVRLRATRLWVKNASGSLQGRPLLATC